MTGIIVFDVDGVLGDGNVAPKCRHVRGTLPMLEVLDLLGYELHAWSAGGADHAYAVVQHGGYAAIIERRHCHAKPPYPMDEAAALAVLGGRPVLQVDDDPTERVGDWPFLWADNWFDVPLVGGQP